MIEYKKVQKIFLRSKIKIKNEKILTKSSLNRVSADNMIGERIPSGIPETSNNR